MARHKIHKKLKIAIVILLIAVLSFETHKLFKRHVVYKKPSKPVQGKKVKIKKIKSKTKKVIQKTVEVNPIQEAHEESIELHNRVIQHQREQAAEDYKQKQIVSQQQEEQIQWINIRISYYTISYSDCGNIKGITSSGKHIQEGMIAAPHDIPFGTQLILPDMGVTYDVQDRGGDITWSGDIMKIDVYVEGASQSELNKLGVKYVKGYIKK